MPKNTLDSIQKFLKSPSIAVVGVSRNPRHFSRMLFRDLLQRGLPLQPVNPKVEEIEGLRCVPRFRDCERAPEAVLIMTPSGVTADICEEAIELGVRQVWMYRAIGHGAVDPDAAERCRQKGLNVVEGECPYMFLEDAGLLHRMHGGLLKLTGKYPVQIESRPAVQ
jgi:uncharacterized protein